MSATVTIDRDKLAELFNAVLAHTADPSPADPWPDELTQVHLEVRGGNLRLVCSDRYTLAVVQVGVNMLDEGFRCSYALAGEAVLDVLLRLGSGDVTLVIEKPGVRFIKDGSERAVKAAESALAWRAMFSRILNPEPVPMGAFLMNPKFMARLAAAQPLHPEAPFMFHMRGEDKVMFATLGDDFIALLTLGRAGAYVRSGQVPEWPLDPWFDLIDED